MVVFFVKLWWNCGFKRQKICQCSNLSLGTGACGAFVTVHRHPYLDARLAYSLSPRPEIQIGVRPILICVLGMLWRYSKFNLINYTTCNACATAAQCRGRITVIIAARMNHD